MRHRRKIGIGFRGLCKTIRQNGKIYRSDMAVILEGRMSYIKIVYHISVVTESMFSN